MKVGGLENAFAEVRYWETGYSTLLLRLSFSRLPFDACGERGAFFGPFTSTPVSRGDRPTHS
jgi:hypothetical protein